MEDVTGITVEDPLAGRHFEIVADNGLEVVLRGTDTPETRTVDRRDFPGRYVPE